MEVCEVCMSEEKERETARRPFTLWIQKNEMSERVRKSQNVQDIMTFLHSFSSSMPVSQYLNRRVMSV